MSAALTPLQKYAFYSTLLAIFSYMVAIPVGGHFIFAFYLLLPLNLLVLAMSGWLWLPRKLLVFVVLLFASGIAGILLGTDDPGPFAREFGGIALCALYYPAFYRLMRFDVERCFAFYAKGAFLVSLFGIVILPFETFNHGRLSSIFWEPMDFCAVCVPAAFYYLDTWRRERRYGGRAIVIIVAALLSRSSGGMIGLAFVFMLLALRMRVFRLIAPFVLAGTVFLAYTLSTDFSLRLDDAAQALVTTNVASANESSFDTVAAAFVTKETFLRHPFFGGGLASHSVAHDLYIRTIPGTEILSDDLLSLGRFDAASLLLRVISEFGLAGIAGAIWFLWFYWPRGGTAQERSIASCVLVYVVLKATRQGAYFNPETFFFFSSYAVNGLLVRTRMRLTGAAGTMPRAQQTSGLDRPLLPAAAPAT